MKAGFGKAAIVAVVMAVQCGGASGALYGNVSGPSARPILADGTIYTDAVTPTSIEAWFTVQIDSNQSYAIEQWSPYGPLNSSAAITYVAGVFEANGVTALSVVGRHFDFPSPQLTQDVARGTRYTFINAGAQRTITIRVIKNGAAPASQVDFLIRIVPTTMAAARWSVNGYNDIFSLSNTSSAPTDTPPLSGQILFFDEAGNLVGSDPFQLAPNGSIQITKPNGVAIGGATRGGVRIVHNGAPGTVLAQQNWFNPVTGQFAAYPFTPLVHAYGRGGGI